MAQACSSLMPESNTVRMDWSEVWPRFSKFFSTSFHWPEAAIQRACEDDLMAIFAWIADDVILLAHARARRRARAVEESR